MKNGASAMETPEQKIRAFIALKPPESWGEQLGRLQRELKEQLRTKALRWAAPEQIHITLRFLGSIRETEVVEVAKRFRGVSEKSPAFRLHGEGLGCFPNARRPRVLWAGLAGDLERVSELHGAINEATQGFGEPPDERPFTPHLTLARVQNLERPNLQRLESILERGFEIQDPWEVKSVLLVRSHLSPQGSRYEILAESILKG
jgi:2'-5' RNA ligase